MGCLHNCSHYREKDSLCLHRFSSSVLFITHFKPSTSNGWPEPCVCFCLALNQHKSKMTQSHSVLPLRSDKAREFGDLWREKCTHAPWTSPFKLARTTSSSVLGQLEQTNGVVQFYVTFTYIQFFGCHFVLRRDIAAQFTYQRRFVAFTDCSSDGNTLKMVTDFKIYINISWISEPKAV